MTMTIETLYHGSQDDEVDLDPSQGVCLTDDRETAEEYGCHVYRTDLDLTSLRIEDVDACGEGCRYPGDSFEERCDMEEEGIDALRYTDTTDAGHCHSTIRLISERAHELAASNWRQA